MTRALTRFRTAVRAFSNELWPQSTGSLAAWDAAKGGSRLGRWTPPSTDFATAYVQPSILKARARDAHRNNPWARRATEAAVAYVVGTGIKPMLDSADAVLKARVHALWSSWTDSSDFSSRWDLYGQQAAAFRACLVDGESLMLIRPGNPLQLQLLPSEYLDASRDNARDIAGGIQYNAAGQRTGYWLYSKHPAQMVGPVSSLVPAELVIHLYMPLQPGAERGVSWLAPALVPLYELQQYTEASLVRGKVATLFAGFVRSADGSDILKTDSGDPVLEPGSVCKLGPGQEVNFSAPPTVENAYDPFVKSQLRAIAAALGMPYEILSGDNSAVTFASGRHGLLSFRRYCDSITHNLLVYQLCRPIWLWWTRIMVAMGELPTDVIGGPVRWTAAPVEMLDSRMEVESTVRRIRAGLTSRAEAVSATGWDIERIDTEIALDNARADRLGLVLDSDPRRVSQQGQEQQQQPEAVA